MPSPRLGLTLLTEATSGNEITTNVALQLLEAIVAGAIVDRDLATPPGSPAEGAVYLVAASPTGAWSGQAGKLAVYLSGWYFLTPKDGMQLFIVDEKTPYMYSAVESLWFPMLQRWRTTEEWIGSYNADAGKIYAKTIDFGALPNTTTKSVAHGITGLDLSKHIGFQCTAGDAGVFAAPVPQTVAGITMQILADGTNISITTSADLSAFTTKIRLEYSKT
jgi:hypothetical protein